MFCKSYLITINQKPFCLKRTSSSKLNAADAHTASEADGRLSDQVFICLERKGETRLSGMMLQEVRRQKDSWQLLLWFWAQLWQTPREEAPTPHCRGPNTALGIPQCVQSWSNFFFLFCESRKLCLAKSIGICSREVAVESCLVGVPRPTALDPVSSTGSQEMGYTSHGSFCWTTAQH